MILEQLKSKIIKHSEISACIQQLKSEGKRIVFSNGCFDIVHKGHIEYLATAAEYGDILIIGLNSDPSVKRLKGPQRPLQDERSRATLMAALSFVDYVIVFEEDTPYNLIQAIVPDILVKGSDYKAEEVVGYDIVTQNGGEVKTVELTQGYSSSNVINKMKETSKN